MFSAIVPNFLPALCEIILAGFCLLGLLIASFKKQKAQKFLFWFAEFALVICLIIAFLKTNYVQITFSGLFKADTFSKTMQILILVGSICCLIFAKTSAVFEDILDDEYPLLFLFATLGMLLMVTGNDLLSVFAGLELLSLCLYIFVALRRNSLLSNEAALKYFILGALSSGLFLYGTSLIYGFTGTTSLEALERLLRVEFNNVGNISVYVACGLIFIIMAMAFKVSMAPFHMWMPDVYQGSSTSVVMFLASAPKIAIFAVFIRILFEPFGVFLQQWYPILATLSMLSMAFGAISALIQTNLRRLLAYSAIGHMGFVMIAICVGNEYGVRSAILYIIMYVLMTITLFGSFIYLNMRGIKTETISDLQGIGKAFPNVSFIIAFAAFSMAGIPPLPGFLAKVFIFQASIYYNAYVLAMAGILYSVVSAAYYLIILKAIFFDKMQEATLRTVGFAKKRPKAILVLLYIFVFASSVVFVYPNKIIDWSSKAATSLLFGR